LRYLSEGRVQLGSAGHDGLRTFVRHLVQE